PTLVDAVREEWAWLVDPVDGTGNFVAGSSEWAVMVALQHRSETVMSWIWQPVYRRMYIAERGAGATATACRWSACRAPVTIRCYGARCCAGSSTLRRWRASTQTQPGSPRSRVGACAPAPSTPRSSRGAQDFALFWRTLPWDHAPPVLLLEEA